MDNNYLIKVKREIHNIKKYATNSQLIKLNFDVLDPNNTSRCIYGLMTGHCNNDEAIKLIKLCCNTKTSFYNLSDRVFIDDKPRSNDGNITPFSYLEHYIYNYRDSNKHIIQFLKGEVDKLKITL
jgi:hypothetical protein